MAISTALRQYAAEYSREEDEAWLRDLASAITTGEILLIQRGAFESVVEHMHMGGGERNEPGCDACRILGGDV